MDFSRNTEGDICRVKMRGKFTFSDHTAFRKLFEVFAVKTIECLELDITEIEFVDSAALGILLLMRDEAEKAGKRLILKNPMGQVRKMFEISRFYDLFEIVQDK